MPSDHQAGKFGQVSAQKLPSTLADAGPTKFGYDGNGNLTTVQNALSPNGPDLQGTTTLKYDQLGQPIEIELTTVIDSDRSANKPDLPVTRTVNGKVPVATGCPVIEPELESVSPPGRVPEESDHEYGGVPPEALNCCE